MAGSNTRGASGITTVARAPDFERVSGMVLILVHRYAIPQPGAGDAPRLSCTKSLKDAQKQQRVACRGRDSSSAVRSEASARLTTVNGFRRVHQPHDSVLAHPQNACHET
jgi:hypothetical protein